MDILLCPSTHISAFHMSYGRHTGSIWWRLCHCGPSTQRISPQLKSRRFPHIILSKKEIPRVHTYDIPWSRLSHWIRSMKKACTHKQPYIEDRAKNRLCAGSMISSKLSWRREGNFDSTRTRWIKFERYLGSACMGWWCDDIDYVEINFSLSF